VAPLAQAPAARGPAPTPAFAAGTPATRVTVLLVMEPGTNGIRRYGDKTADPVICSTGACWIAAGLDRSATVMRRGRALGAGNTLGHRAAACNHRLACAFRGIDLGGPSASLQPIDLRIMRHDRREFLRIEADPTCRLTHGTLTCAKTYRARTWRAWIVPERLAMEAGPAALAAALASGLAGARPSAALVPAGR
jgi:colicin import membrane protein